MGKLEQQIRGWKDIASAINTSVRTARRWQSTRGLPVRRHPGDREAVYVLRGELEDWLKADEAPIAPGHSSTAQVAAPMEEDEPGARKVVGTGVRMPHQVVLFGVTVTLIFVAAGLWAAHPWRSSPSVATVRVETFDLRITRPEGWKAVLTIADGGAGRFGGLPGQPAIVLRPRRVPAGLMLEVGRADGRPVVDRPGAPGPLVILLDPNVPVGLRQPFPFDVEWSVAASSKR